MMKIRVEGKLAGKKRDWNALRNLLRQPWLTARSLLRRMMLLLLIWIVSFRIVLRKVIIVLVIEMNLC